MAKQIKLNIDVSGEYRRLSRKNIWIIFAVILITLVLATINLFLGPINIFNCEDPAMIISNLRLPHVLTSLLVGAVLGVCGCILQSTLGNPLASPSTMGISQGAACGACIGIIIFGTSLIVIPLAFIFALLPTLLILAFSKRKNINATSIILAGIAMSIFFGGLVAIIEYFADSTKVAEVVFWTFGSVYSCSKPDIIMIFIVAIIMIVYGILNAINLNALECGDMTAHTIGVNVKTQRIRHLIVAAAGAACVTAFCGTINFIGLIAPHVMRKFIGANYKYLIPTSALCGAAIVTLSDIISSNIMTGAILPIGAITSFIGAPIFIYVLLKKK
ncbi:MAG: iron ABC transporter permease [Coriobacteriia bacterium]|nr:iron ABC transporter permease [Coriobacteriia bacterium]